jgi:hypothetical protein
VSPLTLERDEFELVQRIWAWLEANGHGACRGWTQDSRDPDGYLQCACGDAVLIVGGVQC